MREIKLNNVEYLRGIIRKATIEDENSLEFKNGVALVEATIVVDQYGVDKTYTCFGLIDENFQEVYNDKKSGSIRERNLMFLKCNRKAERFFDNDYIVEVPCEDDGRTWVEHRHIRIIDGVPTLINKLGGEPIKTKREGLVIVKTFYGLILYDINEGTFVTPHLVSIRETEEDDRLFDVSLKVTLGESKSMFELVDYLFFRIDSTGKIVSSVISSLENGYLAISEGCFIKDLVENRKQSLEARETRFSEEVRKFKENLSATSKENSGPVLKMTPLAENNQ